MIRSLSYQSIGALALCAALVSGCGEKTKPVQTTGDKAQGAKDATDGGNGDASQISATDLLGKDASLIDAVFKADVTSLFGIKVCQGEIQLKLNANIDKKATASMFEIPKGVVDCGLMGKLNLAEMLGAFSQGQAQEGEALVIADNLLKLKSLGTAKFEPARPLLPNFIGTKRSVLESLDHSENIKYTDMKDGKTANGTVTVRTIAMDQSYRPESMDREFNKVVHFEIVNSGFNGANKVTAFLFNKMEFKISLDPVAILHVGFKGKISDYMAAMGSLGGGAGGGGAAGAMGGLANGPLVGLLTKLIDVDAKLDLVSMKGLKDVAADDSESTDDLGEEIGGKSSDDDNSDDEE